MHLMETKVDSVRTGEQERGIGYQEAEIMQLAKVGKKQV